ncbi:MAG: methyltransferase domain-containing protein [Ignavibacteriales bacterium]|nr:methyltransferase domain-containing protein [Ignavibacteriales bacterium]
MFFPQKIRNIEKNDLVLEVGPGADPFKRSDILLEKKFSNEIETRSQRADKGKIKTNKQIVFFDGKNFPFKNKTFDYVICSHVLEHVEEVDTFVFEITRVGRKGYLEFPTIYYDYIYNFGVHKTFLIFYNGVLCWMPKCETNLDNFLGVQTFFYKANLAGRKNIIKEFKKYFFQGFEWFSTLKSERVYDINRIVYPEQEVRFKATILQRLKNILRKK